MPEGNTIKITVPANLHNSAFVRRVSEEVFRKVGYPEEWISRLKLVVDELFMNAVKYGSTQDKSEVQLTYSYDENYISVTIEDDGTGTKAVPVEELHKKIQENEQNTDLTKTSGRGLSMITKQWTDGIKIVASEKGGLAVTFTKKLNLNKPETKTESGSQTAQGQMSEKKVPEHCPTQVIKLSGEIDQSNVAEKTAPVFEQVKDIQEGCALVLDFADLEYINSTFIGNLASWLTSMRNKKGFVRLINVNDQIKEVLDLVGLTGVLEIK